MQDNLNQVLQRCKPACFVFFLIALFHNARSAQTDFLECLVGGGEGSRPVSETRWLVCVALDVKSINLHSKVGMQDCPSRM